MKRKRRHKRLQTALVHNLQSGRERLMASPIRSVGLTAIGVVLLSLVFTKSLPYALAPIDPNLALALNPDNPTALIAKAEKLRAELLMAGQLPEKNRSAQAGLADMKMIDRLPKAEGASLEDSQGELVRLRMEIRRLALRATANDPLNAEPFRLRAETATDYAAARALMEEASKRSRRDAITLFWLLNDCYYHRDFKEMLGYADLLLRTHPELASYVFSYLALLAEAQDGAPLLVQKLADAPSWRVSFFNELLRHIKDADTPLRLMLALKESGKPPVIDELAPYLNYLIGRNSVEAAYNVWLQFLPEDELDTLGLLTHANFEREPSRLAFDWQIARGTNSIAEFVPFDFGFGRVLHVSFGPGRVQFPEVSQIVLLPSGKFRMTGKLKGSVEGKRGLRWQLRCMSGTHRVLGETEMLMGRAEDWRIFSLEANVVQTDDCRGQVLRLIHDSRSASEELLDGEVWFAGLQLERLPDSMSQ